MADTSMSIRDRQASVGPDPELNDPDLQCKSREEAGDPGMQGASVAAPRSDAAPTDLHASYSEFPSSDYDPEAIKAMAKGKPDYSTVSVSATFPLLETVGVSASYTIDRFGHSYFGLSVGVGVGVSTPVAIGATHGTLVGDQPGEGASEEQLRNFLCGDSVGAKGEIIFGAGVTNSSGGMAMETGVATAADVGVSFGHNWGSGCP